MLGIMQSLMYEAFGKGRSGSLGLLFLVCLERGCLMSFK